MDEKTTIQSLSFFYDNLSKSVLSNETDGGGSEIYSMHRVLADPRDPARRPTQHVVTELAVAQAQDGARVLDAGCGWGELLFSAQREKNASGLGLTLSRVQADRACARAADLGVAGQVDFRVQDYNLLSGSDGAFDHIFAIETINHNPSIRSTLSVFKSALGVEGSTIVVDDFVAESAVRQDPRCRVFQHGWRSPSVLTSDEFAADAGELGLRAEIVYDFTPFYTPRPIEITQAAVAASLEVLFTKPDLSAEEKTNHEGFVGGYYLEQLYVDQKMKYLMVRLTLD